MKKLLKLLCSRMMIVILAILIQIVISIMLPYIIDYYFPIIFSQLYISLDLVLRLLAIIAFIRIVNSNMNIEGQLTWSVLLLTLPILGLLLYFLFVRNRPPKKHKKYITHITNQTKQYQVRYREEDAHLKQALGDYYGQFEYIFSTTGQKTFENTQVEYLRLGEVFYKELLAELENAKNYIFMEYFIIERGEMWSGILNVLKRKIEQGVEVRVMYDDLGTINKLPNNYSKRLKKLGIKCVKFNSFVPVMSAFHNNRDHRKITIIDGKVGFMSGINLADEYINVKQLYGHWKDTGIKIKGDALKSLIIMFLQMYDIQSQQIEDFSKYLPISYECEKPSGFVCPYGNGPKYFIKEDVAENVYLNLINQAKKYVWISTPYLIIGNKLTNAICNASLRGVDVRIITPHIPDKKIIHALTRSSYKNLQEAGVKIFEYKEGFIHAKQVICDDCLAVLGTINFDYRSFLHHYECATLMYKTDCILDMKTDFQNLFKQSINMKDFKQKRLVRMLCAMCKIFTPLL